MQPNVYEPQPKPPKLDLRHIEGGVLPAFPSGTVAQHHFPPEVMAAMAAMNLAPPFVPPAQSRATRFINLRGRGSHRGALVAGFGGIDRMVVFESLLELHCLRILLTDRSVIDIWDQPPAIEYINIAGQKTHHTLDYRAEYKDGRLVGYAAKPWRNVYDDEGNPTEFALNMRRVRAAAGHKIQIVTERSFSRIQIQDARVMYTWCRQSDPGADAAVREIIPTLRGTFALRVIQDLSGLGGRAYGAIVRAFRDGLLVKAERKRLDIGTLIKVARHDH
ncbi:MAG: hypothetical protein Devi2KO_33530 [Devosia indica]